MCFVLVRESPNCLCLRVGGLANVSSSGLRTSLKVTVGYLPFLFLSCGMRCDAMGRDGMKQLQRAVPVRKGGRNVWQLLRRVPKGRHLGRRGGSQGGHLEKVSRRPAGSLRKGELKVKAELCHR